MHLNGGLGELLAACWYGLSAAVCYSQKEYVVGGLLLILTGFSIGLALGEILEYDEQS